MALLLAVLAAGAIASDVAATDTIPFEQLLGPLGLTVGAILVIWFGGRVLLSIVREYIADVKAGRDRAIAIAETASDGMADLTAAVTKLTASVDALIARQREDQAEATKAAVEEIVARLADSPPRKPRPPRLARSTR